MGKTTIEWTGETWNPTRGCKMVSPGCANCYAMRMAGRMSGEGGAYDGLVKLRPGKGFAWTGDFREVPEALDIPLRRRKPTTYFVNSMSDLFGEGVSNEFIAAVFGVMAATPQHTYQILTKRADRLPAWFEWADKAIETRGLGASGERHFAHPIAVCAREASRHGVDMSTESLYVQRGGGSAPWPLPNVWLGVSVEDRKHGLPRVEELRRPPAAVRFLSIEPLLEDLGEIDLAGIHWVIIGGESGPGARPFDIAWARRIIAQCREQKVPPFFKQSGTYVKWDGFSSPETPPWPDGTRASDDFGAGGGWRVYLKKKGGDLAELPADLRVREMPEVRRGS